MATNSTTTGYLAPTTAPEYDDALNDILHDAIVGITGITGDLVRPRWQPEPPTQPAFTTNWCAFGIVRSVVDEFAAETMAASGTYTVERDEQLFTLHSFFGPSSHAYAERLRDGISVPQNRDALLAHNVAVQEVQEATILPALLKEKWTRRVDVTIVYRRRTSRVYSVLTIASAVGTLVTESRTVPLTVTP